MPLRLSFLVPFLLIASCTTTTKVDPLAGYEEVDLTTVLDAPRPQASQSSIGGRELASQGKYMVELLGCGVCHTDGALVGEPNLDKSLAGSHIGIAWKNPLGNERPGIVYPPNITPDVETGIGLWSDQQIAAAIRHGVGRHGSRRMTVMPWQGYAKISDDDVVAITAYLRSIEAISHGVPGEVEPGQRATAPFVYFGVYRSE